MSRYHARLSGLVAHLADDAVGIAYSDVKEGALASGLIMCHGTLGHMSQVVELVAEVLYLTPSCGACPVVGLLGVLRACRVEVSVGLLGRGYYAQYTVDIEFQLLIGVGLQDVAGSLDGLVGVGIVKREATPVHLEELSGILHALRGIGEVGVSSLALALAEGQGNGHLAARLEALSPKTVILYFYRSEGYRGDGISSRLFSLLCASR